MKHARPDYDRIQDPSGKIPDNEPVFLLRGQDKLAAIVLRYYARLAITAGCQSDLICATLRQADEMALWHTQKIPDLPR